MEFNRQKRRAAEQLSPYSGNEDLDVVDNCKNTTESPIKKRARAGRSKGINKEHLRGIFGGSTNLLNPIIKNKNDLIAGLNDSFLKALKATLEKQSNRDLRPLIDQYMKYYEGIEKKE